MTTGSHGVILHTAPSRELTTTAIEEPATSTAGSVGLWRELSLACIRIAITATTAGWTWRWRRIQAVPKALEASLQSAVLLAHVFLDHVLCRQ